MIIFDNEPSFSTDLKEWQKWYEYLQTDNFVQANKEDEGVIFVLTRAQEKINFFENLILENATRPEWVNDLNEKANINTIEYAWGQAQKAVKND